MVRDVDLIKYLPPFIQEYVEFKKLTDAENPEFQLLADESESVFNNQFITTCNEKGIAKFEELLHLTPLSEDTLESRISRVLVRWNDTIPYTIKSLFSKLDSLCGKDNYEVVRELAKQTLYVTTHLELYGQVEELDYFLSYVLPANMVLVSDNQIHMEGEAKTQMVSGMVYCETIEISDRPINP